MSTLIMHQMCVMMWMACALCEGGARGKASRDVPSACCMRCYITCLCALEHCFSLNYFVHKLAHKHVHTLRLTIVGKLQGEVAWLLCYLTM